MLLIICRINQIQNPKRPLFRVKSQKNDTIGSATLIAPKITSGIKTEMYGSLFSAHVGRYCLENLYYCIFDCIRDAAMNASAKSCTIDSRVLLSKPPYGYKRQGRGPQQKHRSVAAMAFAWCSCSRPPKICVVLPSKRCQKRTCEQQEKSVLPPPASPMFSSDSCWCILLIECGLNSKLFLNSNFV